MVPLKRRLAVAGVIIVGVLGLNCRDAMEPSLAGHLAFLPTFASRSAGIVAFDRVRLTLVRQPSMVVLDTIIAISPTADSVDLLLTVQLSSPREDLQLYLRLLTAAGDTVFRNTPYPQVVTLTTSGSVAIVTTPIEYVGVGYDAAAVVITTPDTSLLFGDTLRLGAFAFGGLEQIIPGTPIGWRSLDSARVRVPDEAVGTVVGAHQRGPARIVAELLTGPADTVIVTAQPLPATVIKASGDNQTAVPGTILAQPLRVRVLANDGLGVRVPVAFSALAAGASVSLDTIVSDSLGYAQVIGTLGPAIGAQTFEARAAHVATPVTFSATALNATVASVTLDRTIDTIPRAATLQYSATAYDASGLPVPVTIGWSSNVQTVATIDQAGLALALGADSTLIIAAAAGHADTALLYVRALSQVVASPADTVITAVADSFDISATAYDNFGQVVTSGFTRTFTSATPAIVTVDPKTGRTSSVGPGAGAIVIRDSVDANLWVQTTATVRVDQLVKRVHNATPSIALGVGGSAQIEARAYDRNGYPIPGRKFGYVSRDTRFVTVDSSGLVTGVALDATTYVVDSLVDSTGVFWDSTLVQVVSAPPLLIQWGTDSIAVGLISGVSVPITLSRTNPAAMTVFLSVLPTSDTMIARPGLSCGGPVLHRLTITAQSSGAAVLVCGLKEGRVQLVAEDSARVYAPDTMIVAVLATIDTTTRGVVVQMQGALTFTPATVTIKVGESVTWQNFSGQQHTTTSDQLDWDQPVDNGQSFTRTFPTAGVFPYHCKIHPAMLGTVVVSP